MQYYLQLVFLLHLTAVGAFGDMSQLEVVDVPEVVDKMVGAFCHREEGVWDRRHTEEPSSSLHMLEAVADSGPAPLEVRLPLCIPDRNTSVVTQKQSRHKFDCRLHTF